MSDLISVITYTYSTGIHKDQLLSVKKVDASGAINQEFSINNYDKLGNPCNYHGNVLQWNRGRNLASFGSNQYFYNASGIRQEKITASGVAHQYYTEGDRIHKETRGNATLWYYYDQSGITGLDYNGTNYYFQKNIQGDVSRIFDQSGNLAASYIYDAWGNHTVLNPDGTENTTSTFIGNINPFRYRGYYYDQETNLYYLQSRYYDSTIGRFINADDIAYLDPEGIGGLNLYAYCLNNPISYIDPTGNFAILAFILGLTALIGLGLTIGGVASDNNIMTAIGLTMVAVPTLISGGMAIAAGVGGATLTGIVGGVTVSAGIGTGLFASAEYQEATGYGNWIQDSTGMSDGLYNTLLLSTAAIATIGTFASSFCYNFNIKSIDKIGKLIPSNHPNEGYWGIRFRNSRGALRSLELQNHIPHGLHFQLNSWNTKYMSVTTKRNWTWFLKRL